MDKTLVVNNQDKFKNTVSRINLTGDVVKTLVVNNQDLLKNTVSSENLTGNMVKTSVVNSQDLLKDTVSRENLTGDMVKTVKNEDQLKKTTSVSVGVQVNLIEKCNERATFSKPKTVGTSTISSEVRVDDQATTVDMLLKLINRNEITVTVPKKAEATEANQTVVGNKTNSYEFATLGETPDSYVAPMPQLSITGMKRMDVISKTASLKTTVNQIEASSGKEGNEELYNVKKPIDQDIVTNPVSPPNAKHGGSSSSISGNQVGQIAQDVKTINISVKDLKDVLNKLKYLNPKIIDKSLETRENNKLQYISGIEASSSRKFRKEPIEIENSVGPNSDQIDNPSKIKEIDDKITNFKGVVPINPVKEGTCKAVLSRGFGVNSSTSSSCQVNQIVSANSTIFNSDSDKKVEKVPNNSYNIESNEMDTDVIIIKPIESTLMIANARKEIEAIENGVSGVLSKMSKISGTKNIELITLDEDCEEITKDRITNNQIDTVGPEVQSSSQKPPNSQVIKSKLSSLIQNFPAPVTEADKKKYELIKKGINYITTIIEYYERLAEIKKL